MLGAQEREGSRARVLESERATQQRRRCEEELAETRERAAFEQEEARRHAARADELSSQLESAREALDEARERLGAEADARQVGDLSRRDLPVTSPRDISP